MKVEIRIPMRLYERVLVDLRRPHPHAFERAGFLVAKHANVDGGTRLILVVDYLPLGDDRYIVDSSVGARIDAEAIRGAMQHILTHRATLLHVHLHDHYGRPFISQTDGEEIPPIVESFCNLKNLAHGFLIFSCNGAAARIRLSKNAEEITPDQINVVGYPFKALAI